MDRIVTFGEIGVDEISTQAPVRGEEEKTEKINCVVATGLRSIFSLFKDACVWLAVWRWVADTRFVEFWFSVSQNLLTWTIDVSITVGAAYFLFWRSWTLFRFLIGIKTTPFWNFFCSFNVPEQANSGALEPKEKKKEKRGGKKKTYFFKNNFWEYFFRIIFNCFNNKIMYQN